MLGGCDNHYTTETLDNKFSGKLHKIFLNVHKSIFSTWIENVSEKINVYKKIKYKKKLFRTLIIFCNLRQIDVSLKYD